MENLSLSRLDKILLLKEPCKTKHKVRKYDSEKLCSLILSTLNVLAIPVQFQVSLVIDFIAMEFLPPV